MVPTTAYIMMLPNFLKNISLSILMALSNKIGGKRTIIKKLLNPCSIIFVISTMLVQRRIIPASTPMIVVIVLDYINLKLGNFYLTLNIN